MPERSNRHTWRAVIYNRASADKTGQRVSVESQDGENRAWCEREGWVIAATITDNDRSATRYAVREREGYQQVRHGLAGHLWGPVDVLVMWESSRGQRRLEGYVELRELCAQHGVRLAYKGRVYDMREGDDRFATGLDALLDEREAERARERTLRSHKASVAAGKPRGVVPYGYRRVYAPGSNHMLAQEPDPTTAPVVAGIVADVLSGRSLYEIAQRLNRAEVPTPRGWRDQVAGRDRPARVGWSSTMIRNLLRKPTLMGQRTHRGEMIGEGTWAPIVAAGDWHAVQAVLADPGRARHHGGWDAAHLLSGIAECAVCGAWMRPLRNNGRMTYVCAGLVPTAPKAHVARSVEQLDAYVTVAVVSRLSDPGCLTAWVAPAVQSPRDDRVVLLAELAQARATLAEYENAVGAPGGPSAAAFGRIEARLSAQIAGLEERLRPPAAAPAVVAEVAGPDVVERWARLSLDTRRRVLRALVRVQVDRVSRRGVRGFDPVTVRLTWRSGHDEP